MHFTKSSRSASVTSDFLLTAECRNIGGEWKRSFLQLDAVLGNADGSFEVEGRDFSKSAKDVFLKEEGGSTILHASLRKKDRTWEETSFNLDVIVANRNGILCVDKSMIQPPGELVTCDALERIVGDCTETANDLKKQIHNQLEKEAKAASQSINTAFRSIQQMQEVLSDGGAYTYKQDFRPEAAHLGFLFSDATGQWSQLEDAMGTASQRIEDFQRTKLQSVSAEVEAAESKIAAEVDGTLLKQKEAKDHLQSLSERISQHQKDEKCQRLREELASLPDELSGLEKRIHEKKCKMTEYSQVLSEAETSGVTAFQYSQTLAEGREILEEVLRVRKDFDLDNLDILLQF
ncbi:Glutamine-serine-proline rich protein [Neofusicoccum parvum]|nr:Glutamine-serine-proline rich protein [Neofusicoccum parvum]